MVLSKIDENINYLETNNLDKNDEGESYAYKAKIYNKKVKFVLGKPNFEYIDNNIVYFNIYLVKNIKLVSKIGVFETRNTDYLSLLDTKGNISIEKLDSPLFFTYAKKFITNNYNMEEDDIDFAEKNNDTKESDEETDEESDEESETESDEETEDESSAEDKELLDKPILLKTQTKEESEFEISNYNTITTINIC